MTASKVGTSYLKFTIHLHVLPSYFKNRTGLCCDRYEYSLLTAASTPVVRVQSVYAALCGNLFCLMSISQMITVYSF